MTPDQLRRGNEITALLAAKRAIASETQKAKQLFWHERYGWNAYKSCYRHDCLDCLSTI